MGDFRWQHILRHTLYRECLKKISEAEKDRIFCKHDMEHNERVAALLKKYIDRENTDGKNVPELINDDILYAAAYLHDIGRCKQYEDGSNHAVKSAELADVILKDCSYNDAEIEEIKNAIMMHDSKHETGTLLAKLLYRADKKSRPCYECAATKECYWPPEKRNKREDEELIG